MTASKSIIYFNTACLFRLTCKGRILSRLMNLEECLRSKRMGHLTYSVAIPSLPSYVCYFNDSSYSVLLEKDVCERELGWLKTCCDGKWLYHKLLSFLDCGHCR